MLLQQPFEEALSNCAVPSGLQEHIDHLSVLISSSPQKLLLAADLDEDFINEKRIAETLVPTLQPPSILRPKFVTPQPDGFITYDNTSFS